MGSLVGTIALIAISSLISGFCAGVKRCWAHVHAHEPANAREFAADPPVAHELVAHLHRSRPTPHGPAHEACSGPAESAFVATLARCCAKQSAYTGACVAIPS